MPLINVKLAAAAGVGRRALSHLIPVDLTASTFPAPGDPAWLDPIRRAYDGPITLGEDLMRLRVRP